MSEVSTLARLGPGSQASTDDLDMMSGPTAYSVPSNDNIAHERHVRWQVCQQGLDIARAVFQVQSTWVRRHAEHGAQRLCTSCHPACQPMRTTPCSGRRPQWSAHVQVPMKAGEIATPVVEHHVAGDLIMGRMPARMMDAHAHPSPGTAFAPRLAHFGGPTSDSGEDADTQRAASQPRPSGFAHFGLRGRRSTMTTGIGNEPKPSFWDGIFRRNKDDDDDNNKPAPSIANSDMQVRGTACSLTCAAGWSTSGVCHRCACHISASMMIIFWTSACGCTQLYVRMRYSR